MSCGSCITGAMHCWLFYLPSCFYPPCTHPEVKHSVRPSIAGARKIRIGRAVGKNLERANIGRMPEQSHAVRNGIICACVSAASVLASWPIAEMGFVDDWSYVKTAFVFARTDHIVYNG